MYFFLSKNNFVILIKNKYERKYNTNLLKLNQHLINNSTKNLDFSLNRNKKVQTKILFNYFKCN